MKIENIQCGGFDFVYNGKSKSEWFYFLKDVYTKMLPIIVESNKKRVACGPYFLDWEKYFTPIEKNAWDEIRVIGLPFYPQIPVLDYFIDFGDPIKKIGIETDGKEWHQDIKRDHIRDQRLHKEAGWEIYRISGSATYRVSDGKIYEMSFAEIKKIDRSYFTTLEDVLYKIKVDHYMDIQGEGFNG